MEYKLKSVQQSGIVVVGYYEVDGIVYFKALNQDAGTPMSRYHLDDSRHWTEAGEYMRNNGGCVFVPIEVPQG